MNKDKIKTIKLNRFRGATKPLDIIFNKKQPMAMIFGENGTGKSTIVDAIDFIFNKQCGSLKEKSSVNAKLYLPAIGFNLNDVTVSINSQEGKEFKAEFNGLGSKVYKDNALLSVRILRRDRILKLINAKPKERYDVLKDFIDLPNIRSSEDELRKLIKDIVKGLNENIHTKTKKEDTLKESWVQEGKDGKNYLSWAENISKTSHTALQNTIKDYEQCIKLIEYSCGVWEELRKIIEECSTLKEQLQTAERNLQNLSTKNKPEGIIDILTNTQSFLRKATNAAKCPVCEQPISSKDLHKRIADRLNNMKTLTEANNQYKQTNEDYEFCKKEQAQTEEKLTIATKSLINFLNKAEHISESQKNIDTFQKLNILKKDQISLQKAPLFFKAIISFLKELENKNEENTKIRNQLNLVKTAFNSLTNIEQTIKILNQKKEYLNALLQVIETERKAYVADILNNISSDIDQIYSKIHPEEGLNNIQLLLKPKVQGSLNIKSSFQNQTNIPPQAYFSESHLDTLGICIFIAMAKYFKNKVIVLDDVVTSCDQQHLDRFIKMLSDESQNFNQVILTTHYRPWRERYKFHRLPNANIQLIELSPFWSIKEGIKSNQTKLSIEELETLRDQEHFDRQHAGSKSGVFLESILDHLTLLYEIHMPRRAEPRYTLDELLRGSKKIINKIQIQKNNSKESLSVIINALLEIAGPIRNQVGSHWNALGMDISDQEVKNFLNKTIELGKMLICSQCKALPNTKKSDCWQCGCGQLKLYPLTK